MGIHKRKDTGKYEVRIRLKDGTSYSKSFTKKYLAEHDERRVLNAIEEGTFRKQDKNMTFQKASELYFANEVKGNCKESTINGYYGYLNNHILPYFGNKLLYSINKLDVDAFKTHLLTKSCKHIIKTKKGLQEETTTRKLSNQTINHILILLHAIFEYMVDSDVIAKNPAKKVKKMSNDTQEAGFLTIEESNILLKTTKTYFSNYYAILATAIITGIRQGELLALTWKDIDFENSVMSINKTYSKDKVTSPKTKTSIRNIKIPNTLIKILKEHKLASKDNSLNLVFPNSNGNYINCRNLVNRFFKPCLKKAKIKNITWHQLRHSCVTILAENGVNIKCIQKQAGHSSETTTLKVYTHVTADMENQACNVLDKAFAM